MLYVQTKGINKTEYDKTVLLSKKSFILTGKIYTITGENSVFQFILHWADIRNAVSAYNTSRKRHFQ